MKINKVFYSLLLLAVLTNITACKNEGKVNVSSYVTSQDVSSESSKQDDEIQNITVETKSYKDEILNFTYEGKDYSLPLERDKFMADIVYFKCYKTYSEQIINNKLGEKISAKLTINSDMTKIKMCDVINHNGMIFTADMLNSQSTDSQTKDYKYTLKRTGGSNCELTNCDRTLYADLNDLIVSEKSDYAETIHDVNFLGYMFKDGQFILNTLYVNKPDETMAENYVEQTNTNYPSFFGVVQSVDNDKAEIMLNDKRTVCTVPTYYCEGKLEKSLEVMVTLNCDTSLFGSGKIETFDYAVIYTDPDEYGLGIKNFNSLAYAKANPNDLGEFIFTTKDEA